MADNNKKIPAPAKSTTEAVKKSDGKLPFLKRVAKWFRDMKSELKKVIWPTPKQTAKNTGISLAMMAASAVVLYGFDQLAQMAVKALFSLVS